MWARYKQTIGMPVSSNDDPLAATLDKLQHLIPKNAHKIPKPALAQFKLAIEEYKSWKMYQNDVRFVQTCVDYAYSCSDPLAMYRYMKHNKIGEFCAIFYRSWARCLASRSKHRDAQHVLRSGALLSAQPHNMLSLDDSSIVKSTNAVARQMDNRASSDLAAATLSAQTLPSSPPRKRKFSIYKDDDADDDNNNNNNNKTTRTVSDPAKDARECTDVNKDNLNQLSYNELLLHFRTFTTPEAPFGKRELASVRPAKTTAIISHDARLYMNHQGHTEAFAHNK